MSAKKMHAIPYAQFSTEMRSGKIIKIDDGFTKLLGYTEDDVKNADCVILATDVAVSGTERFKGKPVVKVPVSVAIKSPEHLLKQIEQKLKK